MTLWQIGNERIQLDSQLLFQSIILACKDPRELEALFRYELCSYPPALIDSSLMLNQPQKPALADAIWENLQADAKTEPPREAQYVLAGETLLHRVPWPQTCTTYRDLCLLYCNYVTKKYGTAIVVFDGYEELTSKKMTQQRRAKGKVGVTVDFTAEMNVAMKKNAFQYPHNALRSSNLQKGVAIELVFFKSVFMAEQVPRRPRPSVVPGAVQDALNVQNDAPQGNVQQGDVQQGNVQQGNAQRVGGQQGSVQQGNVQQGIVQGNVQQGNVQGGNVQQGNVQQGGAQHQNDAPRGRQALRIAQGEPAGAVADVAQGEQAVEV